MFNISIYHNIKWPKYKGLVFSEFYKIALRHDWFVDINHIALTERSRKTISEVDTSCHNYPHLVLFDSNYEDVPKFRLVYSLVRKIFRTSPDMVILPGYHKVEFWFMLSVCIIKGVRIGVFCDSGASDNRKRFYKTILKKVFFRLCDVFLVYGIRSTEYLRDHGVPPEKIFSGCQAAYLPENYCSSSVIEYRLLNGHKDKVRFLYVGRLSSEKGIFDLLEALSIININHCRVELILVGDGAIRPELEKFVVERNLIDVVDFLGPKVGAELYDQYRLADCLVLPSHSEPWGLVVNEALAYGCPVVVSNICGCVPELVIDGITGYKFKAGDVADLVNKLDMFVLELLAGKDFSVSCVELSQCFTPTNAALNIAKAINYARYRS